MKTGLTPRRYLRYGGGQQRTLYISASAAEGLGERVDIYACNGVFALVSAPGGAYSLRNKERSRAKLLHAQQLTYYLRAMLPGREIGTLPAWWDEERGVLLFGSKKRDTVFDESFHRLELEQVRLFHWEAEKGRLYVPRWMPLCCGAYAAGDTLLLKEEPRGSLHRFLEEGRFSYQAEELLEFVDREWGRGPVFYRKVPEGWLLSPNFAALLDRGTAGGELIPLPTVEKGPVLELGREYAIRLSPEASALLGSRANLLISRDCLALKPHREGEICFRRFSGGASTFHLRLYTLLLSYFPMAERISLRPHGDMLIFDNGQAEEGYPPPEQFFQVHLDAPRGKKKMGAKK